MKKDLQLITSTSTLRNKKNNKFLKRYTLHTRLIEEVDNPRKLISIEDTDFAVLKLPVKINPYSDLAAKGWKQGNVFHTIKILA